ncbi:F-box-like/WD repeat-containing protein TBL1XR1 [Daphnia pulex]|uniref:F-box-like/WD repeat-containing protein TBL1XR1 n=1 Tax=Daphnia pulex TaxID=6669 RepID=UPI001EDE6A57|nr:F-box-like/WD repeat-containing protein TBL1XR1 [Daphnia pulex]
MSVEFVISPKSLDDSALLVSNCAFHPHEPVLACAVQGGPVRLYQQPDAVGSIVPLSKWKETVFNPVSTQYPVSDASCLQWDADGRRLAVGYQNGTLILWNGEDGCRLLERRKHTARIGSIRWNPIRTNVFASASSNDRSALVWDADKKPSPLVQRFTDADRIDDVVWISATQLAFYSRDQTDGIIRICQIGRENPIMALVHGNSINSVRWNSQVNLLASVSSFVTKGMGHVMLQIWSPDQNDPIKTLIQAQSEVRCIDSLTLENDANKPLLVVGGCADGSTIVWNLNDKGNSHKRLDDGHYAAINDLCFSPNRRWLASIDRDGQLIVRLAEDWRKVYETKTEASNCQRALSWSGSSDKLAIVNARYQVFLVEIIH